MASIFVQIPAYHDLELERTLESLYSNSSGDNLINVGIHFNYYEHMPISIEKCFSQRRKNGEVRKIINKAPIGLGASLSRYLANSLYDGEDYYLQLDSHMRLRKNWDRIVIEDFEYLKKNYKSNIVMSAYPNMYTINGTASDHTHFSAWSNFPAESNSVEMNDINWIGHAIGAQIKKKEDRCKERNLTDNRHNNISGAFTFSTGEIHPIYTPLPNVIIEETILSMKFISKGFNIVGRLREVAKHLGPHPYMLSLSGRNDVHDESYEVFLLEYPRRLARVDFADLHPVSRDIHIIKNQLIENPEERYILFNEMSLNEYLELSDLEMIS